MEDLKLQYEKEVEEYNKKHNISPSSKPIDPWAGTSEEIKQRFEESLMEKIEHNNRIWEKKLKQER